jgi:ArsR family transcriptional regulator
MVRNATRHAAVLRALADPTRVRLLNLLRAGELCVGDLVAILRLPQPTASRHLSHLRDAGLVGARKSGLWSFYSLPAPLSPLHEKVLECVAACERALPQLARDAAARERLRRRGGCCPGEGA